MYDAFKIAEAIKKAAEVAGKLIDTPDTGTCNFDSCFLRVPGMRKDKAEAIEEFSGVRCDLRDTKMYGRVLMIGIGSGQANRNTVMAECAHKFLTGMGFNAGMYYQMD